MLSDKGFLEFLDDKSLDGLNETDLKRIIDEESEKSEEEMDTELIEYCLDALNALEEKGKDKKKGEGDANMKNYKLLLFGISLILFGIFAIQAGQISDPDIVLNIIVGIGTFSPIVGIVLCVIGFFRKDNS